MSEGVEAVRTARDRAIAAETAHIIWTTDLLVKLPPARTDRGPVRTGIIGVGKLAGKTVGEGLLRLMGGGSDFRHRTAEGIIDFAGRRYMIDHGRYAVVEIGDQSWTGRHGRALSTLPPLPAQPASPLWLIDLLDGITSTEEVGSEEATPMWRHFAASANLAEASAASPDGMLSPTQRRFEDLLELPVEVWLDTTDLLRQVRFTSDYQTDNIVTQTDTITLSGFGAGIEDLDWTRLPTFRSHERRRSRQQAPPN